MAGKPPAAMPSPHLTSLRSLPLVAIRGAGDLASGVAHRLHRAGFRVVMTETAQPRALRRAVSFSSAAYDGQVTIEGATARLAPSVAAAWLSLAAGEIPVLVDPDLLAAPAMRPGVLVDAIMAKRNLGTCITFAPLVIGLGPGFTAGVDVHVVIETQRGHDLGRVITSGSAIPNTGVPGVVMGYARERVLWSPAGGLLTGGIPIGSVVEAGGIVAWVEGHPVQAGVCGVLRGLLRDGLHAHQGEKIGDVDPRGIAGYCFTISDKARAIGGGVLEAILHACSSSM
jgi:xanthine dehydrogenase accessory factor